MSTCFVDTGELGLLQDATDHRLIILGRTGAGKSALLLKLAETKGDQVIQIHPESLALTYVSNSTILNYFATIGVNLDPFFKLLWRHVLTVEILNRHFQHYQERRQKSLLEWLASMFTGSSRHDKEMQEAIHYLQDWGKSFWQETEFRVKEITRKLEGELQGELKAQLGITGAGASSTAKAMQRVSEDQKVELVSRGQEIVSAAQVQDLSKVMTLLDTVLEDRQRPYYIFIDQLDENWVEERIRYKLIMALVLTARDFIRVENAKVLIALRRDLIDRVFRLTRASGFQEEKYQSLYMPLAWTKRDLIKVLDTRVDALVAHRYTKKTVTHRDLLPRQYNNLSVTDYIMERVEQPRDVIAFFNACIAAGTNLSRLTQKEFTRAVGEYSRSRLRALGDEWSSDFPTLLDFTDILKRRPASFKIGTLEDRNVEELCLRVAADDPGGTGLLQQYALRLVDCIITAGDFKVFLVQLFFRIGLVGLKLQPHEAVSWVDERGRGISFAEISDDTSVVVHQRYHRALGIKG